MDHEQAVQAQAVERYILGELSSEEREQFEDHFFDCPACAAELKTAFVFVANARQALLAAPRRAGFRSRFSVWLAGLRPAYAMAAAGVLLALLGYQALVRIPRLEAELARARAPQPYAVFVLHGVARGDDQVIQLARGAQFVGLSLDVPPGPSYPEFICEVLDEGGRTALSVAAPAPASPGVPLNVLIPGAAISPGRYTLILRGRSGGPAGPGLSRYQFTVQLQP